MDANEDRRVAGVTRKGQTYVVIYGAGDDQVSMALRVLGKWASNPDLDFTWYDAAVLSQRIRRARDMAKVRIAF